MKLRTRASDRDRAIWLGVLILLAALVPAAYVLWFTNEAISTQSAAARQRVLEAYRGQLRLVRSRIDAHWRDVAAQLDGKGDPVSRFTRLTLDEKADGVLVLNPDGSLAFPQLVAERRVVVADQQLLRIQLLAAGNPSRPARIDRLAVLLNDYTVEMSSAQRLFLMGELRLLSPNVRLPTEGALRLSTQVAERGGLAFDSEGFRPTAISDVWALGSADRTVIGLFRTGRLEAMMHDLLHQVEPEGIRFIAFPPGEPGDAEAVAAGAWLPGWQLSFMPLDDTPFDAAGRREAMTYLWVGVAGIGTIAVLGLVIGSTFRRHLRVARLKTDLVAAVSHELRTPLTSMRVLVDGLLADGTFDPVKTREYLEMVATENARLSRLIENFLTFSRLERRRHQFEFAAVDPATIVASAIDAVRERLPASCDLQVHVERDLPRLNADGDALCTALINLLDNAIKYTAADKRILVRARSEGGSVVFAVQDNGIGIPVREQRRIFRRFYRVDRRLASDTTGVGLGLSIVDLIVRAHGGTVTVESESGAGSTFAMRVPAVMGTIAPAELRREGAGT